MALREKASPIAGPGRVRIAAWASFGLYLVAGATWALTSWRSTRGTATAFAADLTGLALWGSLLAALLLLRRVLTLFSAVQVALDLVRRG
jgi:hypothetical protein